MRNTLIASLAVACLPFAAAAQDAVSGDAAAGEKVFRKCQACHAVGADAANKTGPELNGIVGRVIASEPDFSYSDALTALGADGTVWTPETLAQFIEKPKDYAPGTKMSFAGLRKEEERTNVIAYLATFPAEGS